MIDLLENFVADVVVAVVVTKSVVAAATAVVYAIAVTAVVVLADADVPSSHKWCLTLHQT